MLALDDAYDPVFELNQPLVEAAQRSLGRMSLADRASALIKSAVLRGGAGRFLRFRERRTGSAAGVRSVSTAAICQAFVVPGLYTYAGFNTFYLGQLSRIAQMLVDDQWVIGGGGEQGGIDQELLKLGPELLDRYGKEFAAAWNGVLDKLKFKAMLKDKPHYIALSAAASPTSPIEQLFEAIADETALTRDAAAGKARRHRRTAGTVQGQSHGRGMTWPRVWRASASNSPPASRKAVPAQDPQKRRPESRREHRSAVQAVPDPGRAALPDSGRSMRLTQNFHDIYQSLLLAADVPSQTERVNANLQLQIATLRANASRLPKPLARMVNAAADEFEGNVAETSMAQLEPDARTDGHGALRGGDQRPLIPSPATAPRTLRWRISPSCSRRAG